MCVCARTRACVSLHVGLFLPLAVQSSVAALGPQTEAVVVSTLCKKAVVPQTLELGHVSAQVREGHREEKAPPLCDVCHCVCQAIDI